MPTVEYKEGRVLSLQITNTRVFFFVLSRLKLIKKTYLMDLAFWLSA